MLAFGRVKIRDIVIGIVIVAFLTAIIIVAVQRARVTPKLELKPSPTPSIQQNIERTFNITIPENVTKAELTDVSGGTGEGVATKESQNATNLYTILANLENPPAGKFYQGWLIRGKEEDKDYAVISMGKLRIAKGGWLGEFQSKTDYPDYKNVLVTLETKETNKPGNHILEGSF